MSAHSSNDKDFQQREQELREREMKVRLRELEAELDAQRKNFEEQDDSYGSDDDLADDDDSRGKAAKRHQIRNTLKALKFILIAVGMIAIVVIVKTLLPFMIVFGVLGLFLYGIYIFFIQDKADKNKE